MVNAKYLTKPGVIRRTFIQTIEKSGFTTSFATHSKFVIDTFWVSLHHGSLYAWSYCSQKYSDWLKIGSTEETYTTFREFEPCSSMYQRQHQSWLQWLKKFSFFKNQKANFLLKIFHGNFKSGNFIFEVQVMNNRFDLKKGYRFWHSFTVFRMFPLPISRAMRTVLSLKPYLSDNKFDLLHFVEPQWRYMTVSTFTSLSEPKVQFSMIPVLK